MAYGNNAVQLTIDSYISQNIEFEIENINIQNSTENINKYQMNKFLKEDEEVQDPSHLSFQEKRTAAYQSWLSVPSTPYAKVNVIILYFILLC